MGSHQTAHFALPASPKLLAFVLLVFFVVNPWR
jgi:hypothetical protein